MLGESIFSLLIVDVPEEGTQFFATFLFGILTIMLLHFLHFQSQPHDPDDHAIRRHKNAGVMWNYIMQIYSFMLVCLGASYTFFLTDFEGTYALVVNSTQRAKKGWFLTSFRDRLRRQRHWSANWRAYARWWRRRIRQHNG